MTVIHAITCTCNSDPQNDRLKTLKHLYDSNTCNNMTCIILTQYIIHMYM